MKDNREKNDFQLLRGGDGNHFDKLQEIHLEVFLSSPTLIFSIPNDSLRMTSIAQTPIMESSNPLDKLKIPTEARNQQIVGQTGEAVHEDTSKLLLAIDGTEAGDKAFKYLMESKVSPQRAVEIGE